MATVAMDMPDSAGWWARDGDGTGLVKGEPQFVSRFVRWDVHGDEVFFQWGVSGELIALPVDEFKRIFGGKWYKMPHMPWESQPPPTPALSPQTVSVARECIESEHNTAENFIDKYSETHPRRKELVNQLAEYDAALAELDALAARAQGEG